MSDFAHFDSGQAAFHSRAADVSSQEQQLQRLQLEDYMARIRSEFEAAAWKNGRRPKCIWLSDVLAIIDREAKP